MKLRSPRARRTSRPPPEQLLGRIERLVVPADVRVGDPLLATQAEEAERDEAVEEEVVHVPLEVATEIDHDVPAQDEVELVERAVRREVVLREDHALGQRGIEDAEAAAQSIVVLERAAAPRPRVVVAVELQLVRGHGELARALER